jgi:general stress protein 26
MKVTPEHRQRVQLQLRKAGATWYGLLKNESRHLPHLIHPSESIEGIAYGRYEQGGCMLVATNSRILFLDKKPLFTFSDELTYDVIAGVGCSRQGYFAKVTLHTRFNDTVVEYVNWRAAEQFVRYIERRRIEEPDTDETIEASLDRPAHRSMRDEEVAFLAAHRLGTLSTTDPNGHVHGSVIPYYVESNDALYILAKPTTTKAQHIFAHHFVALTVYDEPEMQTLQLHGTADVEVDPVQSKRVLAVLEPMYTNRGMNGHSGNFLVFRISPSEVKLSNYGHPGLIPNKLSTA